MSGYVRGWRYRDAPLTVGHRVTLGARPQTIALRLDREEPRHVWVNRSWTVIERDPPISVEEAVARSRRA